MLKSRLVLRAARGRSLSSAAHLSTPIDEQHCASLLRRSDYDYWLAGLLLPADARPAYYAIRAFNVETAGIVEAVRGNVLPGRMRVQWWKDVVHSIYSDPTSVPSGYPVVSCLADAVYRHKLSRRWFDKCLDARGRDLEMEQPQDMGELFRYCEDSHSSLALLALECLAPQGSLTEGHLAADLAAQHYGRAVGAANLLR